MEGMKSGGTEGGAFIPTDEVMQEASEGKVEIEVHLFYKFNLYQYLDR